MDNNKYTEQQNQIAEFKEGNLQIIACAGSGKTTSISRRVANLIKDGVKPQNIVAFTFTDKAAEMMKFRIRKFISEVTSSPGDLGNMYVGTIHSYCFDLLKKYRPEFLAYEVLDDNQRTIFVKKHYFELGLNDPDLKHFTWYSNNPTWITVSNIIKNIDILREEMITSSKLSNKKFLSVYKKYDELLHKKKYLDFSSMMHLTVQMLEQDFEILTEVRNNTHYLIVDEYQDINPVQERLIELISMKRNVCVVGDDDQSIYQWRGTKVKNILTFEKRYTKITQIPLSDNFRGSSAIIKHANSVISKMGPHKRLEKEMRWGNRDRVYEEGDIYSVFFNSQTEEVEFFIKKMKELHGTKFNDEGIERAIDWKDFALIFRSVARHAAPFIQKLKEERIPYVVKGSIGLFDREEIRFILDCLAFILEPEYNITYNLESEDSKRLFSNLFEKSSPGYDLFLKKINKLKSNIKNNKYVNLQRILQQLLNVIGIREHIIREDILYNLGQMSIVISDYEGQNFPVRKTPKNLADFFEFLVEYAAFSYEEGGHEEKFGGVNAVQIMTMHRCKGLEFPVVFLPSFTKNAFPLNRRDETKWFIDDELLNKREYATSEDSQRRLLYVAMTRSMKYLFVICSRKMPGYERDQLPSEFVADFADRNVLHKPVEDPTKRYKSTNFSGSSSEVFPTNFSELGFYFDCPQDFKLRMVLGFNPVLDPMLGYGKSIHNILNNIHKKIQRKKEIDVDKLIDNNFQLRFAKKEDEDISKKKAEKVIKNYLNNYKEDIDLSLETEKPFEMVLGNALVSGQIDLIRKQTPKGEEITIVEFKTELDPDEFRKTKHKDQVTLYGLAYEKSFGKKPDNLFVHYLDESKSKREAVTLNTDNVKQVINKINNAVEEIKKGNFPKKPCEKSKCANCNFKLICKGVQ